MKKKKKQDMAKPHLGQCGRPTLLEYMTGFGIEAAKVYGLNVTPPPSVRAYPVPKWGKKILEQFKKTIMRPVLKLRPGAETDCQQYGKIIGILNRQIKFFQSGVWEIAEREGWDKITEEDWERIQPRAQLRAHLVKILNRPVADNEAVEDLAWEAIERKITHLENLRSAAYQFVSNRSAKEQSLFYKGMAQGYELFINAVGDFCGDRGRTEIYLELLSSQYEIEKMRRMLPARNDSDLYEHLKPWHRFPNGREAGTAWLRKVCDDISLYMTGKRGRPPGPRHAPVF